MAAPKNPDLRPEDAPLNRAQRRARKKGTAKKSRAGRPIRTPTPKNDRKGRAPRPSRGGNRRFSGGSRHRD